MDRETINYNIHNMLSFQINRKRHNDLIKDMNMPYSYFETEHIDDPDIILNLCDFTPQNEGCHVVDHKWYIRHDYIYCSEYIHGVRFDVEIIGVETTPTIINVSTNFKKIKQLLLPSVLPQIVTMQYMIQYKLLQKGFVSIHAASVANEKGAVVFLGRGGTFKTTLAMDYIKRMNYMFLGDDRVIIRNKNAFSFPLHLKLFDYRVKKMKTEDYKGFDKYKYLLYQRSPDNHFPNYVIDKAPISTICLISKSEGQKITTAPLSKTDVLIKTLNSHKMENINGMGLMGIAKGLYDYFSAYSYVFPESQVAGYWDAYYDLLDGFLDLDRYYEITLPKVYTDTTFRDFVDSIQKLGLNQ